MNLEALSVEALGGSVVEVVDVSVAAQVPIQVRELGRSESGGSFECCECGIVVCRVGERVATLHPEARVARLELECLGVRLERIVVSAESSVRVTHPPEHARVRRLAVAQTLQLHERAIEEAVYEKRIDLLKLEVVSRFGRQFVTSTL
jgi:hypothetical protein